MECRRLFKCSKICLFFVFFFFAFAFAFAFAELAFFRLHVLFCFVFAFGLKRKEYSIEHSKITLNDNIEQPVSLIYFLIVYDMVKSVVFQRQWL